MLLRQLFEEINKTAVLGWGRGMGHKGHMLLAKAVLHHAQEIDAKAYFVVSRTSLVDPATGQPWADRPTFTKTKDDPLSPEEKLATYRKVFPQNADVFSVATADASTLDKVLVKIARDGFTKVTLIVGELEKDSFSFLTRPDKSGIPPYQKAGLRDLEIISRQDTSEPSSVKGSPDYQEGPRATPMRTVLTDPTKSEEEQFAVWRDAMPDNLSDDEVMDLMNKAKQRMAAVPAAKNAKKAKQAVAEVSLDEGPSLPSTLKSIATNGEPITQLYGKLQAMAKRWVDNNGSLKGFHRNAAGQSAQWFNNFYFNKLQADLYALAKQAPRHAAPLIVFLKDASEDRESRINFTEISRSLPPILFRMGKKIDDESLARFAASWDSRRKEYESYLSDLEDQADGEDDFDEPVVKPEKSKMPGQQNAQAEQIVNDILSKLPKNVAGDIRNAIARAPNKLQALHQELSKRKIQGVAEGSQEINWVKPNFDFEWHEVEEQSRMKQVPVDVRQYYQKHFPNKDAWLKAVQNGKAVVVPPDHAYEIRNAPFDKASLQKVLAPTGHEGPIGPAKEKRVNDLFDKGQVEMPIILKTSQGLWLIGGKTRLGTANYVKGLPAKVWLISGEQGVSEAANTSGAGAGMTASYQARENQPVAERHIQDYMEEARS